MREIDLGWVNSDTVTLKWTTTLNSVSECVCSACALRGELERSLLCTACSGAPCNKSRRALTRAVHLVIHCHRPLAGGFGRVLGSHRRRCVRVYYSKHSFVGWLAQVNTADALLIHRRGTPCVSLHVDGDWQLRDIRHVTPFRLQVVSVTCCTVLLFAVHACRSSSSFCTSCAATRTPRATLSHLSQTSATTAMMAGCSSAPAAAPRRATERLFWAATTSSTIRTRRSACSCSRCTPLCRFVCCWLVCLPTALVVLD